MATEYAVTAERLPTPDEIHRQLLNDLRFRYANAGLAVNVKKGSAAWYKTQAYAQRVSLAVSNGQLRLKAVNPYQATGDDLTDLAGFFGVTAREASTASGYVTISLETGTASVNIPEGFKLTSPSGIQYQTTAATTAAADGDTIQIEAVEAGEEGNESAGTLLTWDSATISGLKPKATVTSSGIVDGRPADGEETLRARLLRRLAFPIGGGNWAQVISLAEEASAAVDVAFAYPTASGPASYHVALMGPPADRVLSTTTVTTVANYISAEMPGDGSAGDKLTATTVAEEEIDAVVDLDLPKPVLAGGTGGGWVGTTQWPTDAETGSNVFAEVTATGTGTITVNRRA
jgi:uncharacterized phage protein gp47/JayE